MTEAEWLACAAPFTLLRFVRLQVEPARFRWLAADWGRRIAHIFEPDDRVWFDAFDNWVAGAGPHPSVVCRSPHFFPLDRPNSVLLFARRCADAIRRDQAMDAAVYAGLSASEDFPFEGPGPLDFRHTHRSRAKAKRAAAQADADARRTAWWAAKDQHTERVEREFCDHFRDVTGNPFRPATAGPRWLTPTVRAIAEGIYADRAFDRLPVLADALEDAGCENADLVTHCRSDGPHVRGCWAVDLVLGKE